MTSVNGNDKEMDFWFIKEGTNVLLLAKYNGFLWKLQIPLSLKNLGGGKQT